MVHRVPHQLCGNCSEQLGLWRAASPRVSAHAWHASVYPRGGTAPRSLLRDREPPVVMAA